MGTKGQNDVISMLNHFIDNYIDMEVDTLYIFSDNCSAQNKSNLMIMFLHMLVATGRFAKIVHHFPEPGHSYLPCDAAFGRVGVIKKKYETIHLPGEYHAIVKQLKNNEVIEVSQAMLKDYSDYLTPWYRKPRSYQNLSNANKWNVSKYRLFSYIKQSSGVELTVSYGQTWEEPMIFNIAKARANFTDKTRVLQPLYVGLLPISQEKYLDVLKLAEKYVPNEKLEFYRTLTYTDKKKQPNVQVDSESSDGSYA